jgi:hypothetical protein
MTRYTGLSTTYSNLESNPRRYLLSRSNPNVAISAIEPEKPRAKNLNISKTYISEMNGYSQEASALGSQMDYSTKSYAFERGSTISRQRLEDVGQP